MGHADYTQGTGNGGIMLIRVADAAGTSGVINGNDIQFHIQAGLSATFTNALKWKRYINGAWTDPAGSVAYGTGRPWVQLATHNITYTQDVCFGLLATGTQGLGGPTDFWLRINRAVAPAPPTPLGFDQITHTSLRYRFSGNSDGGAPIDQWLMQFGTNPTLDGAGNVNEVSNGTTVKTGLNPAVTYYAWSIGHNSVGYGGWSSRSQAQTLSGAKVRVNGAWVDAVPYVKVAGAWVPAVTYVKVNGIWVPTTS